MRHGETDWNRENRIMGQQDIPLNAKGIAQVCHASLLLENEGINRLVASPLARAKQSAEIIGAHLNLDIEFFEDLKEINWGEVEGKIQDPDKLLKAWIKGKTPPQAESFHAFQSRISDVFLRILKADQKVLILSHGGVYLALMSFMGYKKESTHNAVPFFFRPPLQEAQPWFVCPLESNERGNG